MAAEGTDTTRVDSWGPVCRGFQVLLPDGQRGCVEEIRLSDDGVELVVATGLFVRRLLIVEADEIESILPASSRIVVRAWSSAAAGPVPGRGHASHPTPASSSTAALLHGAKPNS